MRTAVLREVGGLCPDSPPQTSDMNLWIQLASIGNVGRINGPVQGLYRVHDASMLRTTQAGILSEQNASRSESREWLTVSSTRHRWNSRLSLRTWQTRVNLASLCRRGMWIKRDGYMWEPTDGSVGSVTVRGGVGRALRVRASRVQ